MNSNSPEDALDLMRDEFQRIIANPDSTSEIKGLCVRAISEILVRVPIIEERDRLERKCAEQGLNLATLCDMVLGENAEKRDDKTLISAVRGILNEAEKNKAKLSERKTVHEWLNQIGAEDTEANGKPMCLLRRLAVQLGIQPYSIK